MFQRGKGMGNIVWLLVLGVYGYNVYLQYKELKEEESKPKRIALSLILPPYEFLGFMLTWVRKTPVK